MRLKPSPRILKDIRMRVGVLATAQHSMFSSGVANTTLAIAELMREFGHDVEFVQLVAEKTWWDDCSSLGKQWKVVPIEEAKGYDLPHRPDTKAGVCGYDGDLDNGRRCRDGAGSHPIP